MIELLIVITIIAILAGAVLPYAQRYVEDARIAKVKRDLDEIRSALVRYEVDQNRLYSETSITRLIGSYLSKPMTDAWGSAYGVAPDLSFCFSNGPDRLPNSGDEIRQYFRPPLAISRAYWLDANKSGRVDEGDALQLKFTRPLRREVGDGPTTTPIADDDLQYSGTAPVEPYIDLVEGDFSADFMTVRLTFGPGSNPDFKPNQDTVWAKLDNRICDGEGIPCLPEQPVVIKSY